MTFEQCDEFTRGYIECALWLFDDDPGQGEYQVPPDLLSSLAPDAIDRMAADCAAFQQACKEPLSKAYGNDVAAFDEIEAVGTCDGQPYTASRAGHDFWLTRNRHGAGYWDRDLGPVGDALTERAHEYGSADLYRGDDGLIYLS